MQSECHAVPIQYNTISNDNSDLPSSAVMFGGFGNELMEFNQEIRIRSSDSLGDLREKLSIKVGIDKSSLIISSHFGGEILKNDNKPLSYYGIGINVFQIYLKKGIRNLQNLSLYKFELFFERKPFLIYGYIHLIESTSKHCIFIPNDVIALIQKFYFYDPDINEKILYFGTINLDSNWSMETVKKTIYKYCCTDSYTMIRIRDFHDDNKLTQIYHDDSNLSTNCLRIFNKPCYDGIRICCQEITMNEYFTSNKMLLNVSRMYVLQNNDSIKDDSMKDNIEYEEFMEISFEKQINLNGLRKQLKEISNGMIGNIDDIYVTFMSQETFQQLKDTKKLSKLWEEQSNYKWIPNAGNIDNLIIISKEHKTGDVLLYRELSK